MLLSRLSNHLWHLAIDFYSWVSPVFNKIKISMLVYALSCAFSEEISIYVGQVVMLFFSHFSLKKT